LTADPLSGRIASEMRLSEYLARAGENESEFSRRSGVPQQTVNRLCRGEGGPRGGTALKIERATGGLVKLKDLVEVEPVADGDAA